MTYLQQSKRNFKGLLLKLYLILHGCEVGKDLKCQSYPRFRSIPNNNMRLGKSVTLGNKIYFEPNPKGKIIIGDFVELTQNVLISSNTVVEIGDHTVVGENVSIRDGNHSVAKNEEIIFQGSVMKSVSIGRDVNIGKGSLILMGSNVPDGVVIGEDSVVLEKK